MRALWLMSLLPRLWLGELPPSFAVVTATAAVVPPAGPQQLCRFPGFVSLSERQAPLPCETILFLSQTRRSSSPHGRLQTHTWIVESQNVKECVVRSMSTKNIKEQYTTQINTDEQRNNASYNFCWWRGCVWVLFVLGVSSHV